MSVRILHLQSNEPLERVAQSVLAALDITDYEERDSDNYPRGIYYRGSIGDIEIKVAGESDDGWEDHQYWVVLTMDEENQAEFEIAWDTMIVRLLGRGFALAREVGHTDTSIEREIYRLVGARDLRKARVHTPLPS